MDERGKFERGPQMPTVLREATVRTEGSNYVYEFNPPLSIQELRANPEYQRVAQESLRFGGFRAKLALTSEGEAHGLLELQVSARAYEEQVAAFFGLLRTARIADIHLDGASFQSGLETLKPRNEAERALLSLLARQVSGARIDARIEQEANGTFKRIGYALMDGNTEVAFAAVPTQDKNPATILTSLMATRDSYLSDVTQGIR